ncbi:16771_t:CDS:2 [Gigaspora rosea]|nr:16771_t:CDS:2 [Gigaspora rosea]
MVPSGMVPGRMCFSGIVPGECAPVECVESKLYYQEPKPDTPIHETNLFKWFWDNLDSGSSDWDVLVNEETEFTTSR